jgi:tetrahydromethanopterin S-methyltransferase subunit E
VLVSYILYTGNTYKGTTALQISIGVALIQFLLIILISAIRICNKYRRKSRNQNVTYQDSEEDEGMVHERVHDPGFNADMYIPVRNTIDTY